MKLEIGKTYRTRNDRKVTIEEKMGYEGFVYRATETFSEGCNLTYKENGEFGYCSEHPFDIIAEWKENNSKKLVTLQGDRIEVGEIYLSRHADKVFITDIQEGKDYPVRGIIAKEDTIRYFNAQGESYNSSGRDLICHVNNKICRTNDGKIVELNKFYKNPRGEKILVSGFEGGMIYWSIVGLKAFGETPRYEFTPQCEWEEEKPWIEWIPISYPKHVEEIKLRNGCIIKISKEWNKAGWLNEGMGLDIVAYKLKN